MTTAVTPVSNCHQLWTAAAVAATATAVAAAAATAAAAPALKKRLCESQAQAFFFIE